MFRTINRTIKKSIRNWITTDDNDTRLGIVREANCSPISTGHRNEHGLQFRVTPATGGVVIDIERYNDNGPNYRHTYIVTDDNDLSDCLRSIIDIELLKR